MIHIACLDISSIDDETYRRLYAQSCPQRRQRADRYLRTEDKLRCIAADALLRHALAQTLQITDYTIATGPFGKPYLRDREDFHYNISHSGRWVVIAYGTTPVGIDVEKFRTNVKKNVIASRSFTDAEQAYLSCGDEVLRTKRFFQIWTAKESYLKYLGTGLHRSLSSFSVLPDPPEPDLHFHSIPLPDHYMTLCSQEQHYTVDHLDPSALIPNEDGSV